MRTMRETERHNEYDAADAKRYILSSAESHISLHLCFNCFLPAIDLLTSLKINKCIPFHAWCAYLILFVLFIEY